MQVLRIEPEQKVGVLEFKSIQDSSTYNYSEQLQGLFVQTIKKFLVDGFAKIDEMRKNVEEQIDDSFSKEKKLQKIYNRCLDDISELEDYMEAKQEQIKEERRNADFYPVLQLKQDRGGEFFADITFDNRNRPKKAKKEIIIKEKSKKS